MRKFFYSFLTVVCASVFVVAQTTTPDGTVANATYQWKENAYKTAPADGVTVLATFETETVLGGGLSTSITNYESTLYGKEGQNVKYTAEGGESYYDPDNYKGIDPVPFPGGFVFPFNNQSITRMKIGADGVIYLYTAGEWANADAFAQGREAMFQTKKQLGMRFHIPVKGSNDKFRPGKIIASENSKLQYWVEGQSGSRILVVDFVDFTYSNENQADYGASVSERIDVTVSFQIQMYEGGKYVYALGDFSAEDISVKGNTAIYDPNFFICAFTIHPIAGTGSEIYVYTQNGGGSYNQFGFATTTSLTSQKTKRLELAKLGWYENYERVNNTWLTWAFKADKVTIVPIPNLGIEVSMLPDGGGESQDCQKPEVCTLPGAPNVYTLTHNAIAVSGNITVDANADSVMFVIVEDEKNFTPSDQVVYDRDTVTKDGALVPDFGENGYAVWYKMPRSEYGFYYFDEMGGLEENTTYRVEVYAFSNSRCENGPVYSDVLTFCEATTLFQKPGKPQIGEFSYAESKLTFGVTSSDGLSDSILVVYSKDYPISEYSMVVNGRAFEKGDVVFQNEENSSIKAEVLFAGAKNDATGIEITDVVSGSSYYVYAWSYRNRNTYSSSCEKSSYYQPSDTLPISFGVDPLISADGVDNNLPWAGWGEMNGWSVQTLDYSDGVLFSGNYTSIFYGSVSGENPVYMQFPAFVLDAEKNLNFSMDYALVTGGGSYTMQAGDYIVVEYAQVSEGFELSWNEAGRIVKGSSLSVGDIAGVNRANVKATLGEGTWVVRVGFKATNSPCYADFLSMRVSESSTCVQPVLTLDSVNDDLAVVVWNTVEGAQGYEYRFAKASESIDSKEYTLVSDTSAVLSSLDSATVYNVQVRTKCGGSTYSEVSVLSFSTMYTLPYKASYQNQSEHSLLPGFKRYQAEGGEYSESASGWFVTDAFFREPAGKTLAVGVNSDSSVVQLPAFYHRESVMPILSFDFAFNKYVDLKEGCNLYVYVSDEPSTFDKSDTVYVMDYNEIDAHDGKFIAHSIDLTDNALLQKEGAIYVSFGWESSVLDNGSGMVYVDNIYFGSANCGEISSFQNDSVQEEAAYFSVQTDAYAVKFFYRVKGTAEYDSIVLIASESMVLGGLISNTEYEYIAKACADKAGILECPVDSIVGSFTTRAYDCPAASIEVADSTYTSITYKLLEGSGWLKQVHVFGPNYDSVFEIAKYTSRLTVENLQEQTLYHASIRTYKGNSFSEWSDTVEHSTRMRCPVPVLSHSQVTDNSAVITCSGSALSFDKEFRIGKQGEDLISSDWSAEAESFELTSLSANTSYVYAARTVCAEGDTSAWSVDATFATLPEEGQCLAPENLDTVSVGATSATFEVESDILAKELYIFEQKDEEGLTFEWNTAAAFEATGLTEGTTYYATVRAVCGKDTYSDWSDTITFTTKVIPCLVPEGFDTVIVRETLAAFTTAELGLKEILVYAASETMDETKAKTWAADESGYEWSGLKEGTEYKAVVRAVCSETKKSAWTAPLTFTTKTSAEPEPEVCGVPTSLVAEADTLSASLKWTAGENNVSFMVRYKKADDDNYTEVASENDTLVLNNLDAKTAYVWSVCGVCEESKSAYATDAEFTTLGKEVSNEASETIRFQVLAQNGMVHVLNPDMNRIDRVQILSANGAMISDVVVRSSDNVSIPVQGGRVVLVSVYSNGFRATYKVFVR